MKSTAQAVAATTDIMRALYVYLDPEKIRFAVSNSDGEDALFVTIGSLPGTRTPLFTKNKITPTPDDHTNYYAVILNLLFDLEDSILPYATDEYLLRWAENERDKYLDRYLASNSEEQPF